MMGNGREVREIKRVRNEILVALKVIYPGAMQAHALMRSLLVVFPTLEFHQVRRDLHYLQAKGYLARVTPGSERDSLLTPWRRRWFRLTPVGVELAEKCIQDPALEE